MSELLAPRGTGLTDAEGQARVRSAVRFLTSVTAVAYQSPAQYSTFSEALGLELPARLPLVAPMPRLFGAFSKTVESGDRPVRYLFAARPDFDRGLWLLLAAWRRWKPTAERAELVIATHAMHRSLHEQIGNLRSGGEKISVLTGVLGVEGTQELHRTIHFYVNPAAWREPGSSSVLEALALGTPVIVPTGSGSSDLVQDGVNGFRYQFRDETQLVEALDRAAESMKHWDAMKTAARGSADDYAERSRNFMTQLLRLLRPARAEESR